MIANLSTAQYYLHKHADVIHPQTLWAGVAGVTLSKMPE